MVNVISFCLYGPENPRYYPGMIENVILANAYFPLWKVFVYYAPDVTQSMITQLQSFSNVVLRPTGQVGPINMIHRFYAIDEATVDLMMVRDADSRIHWKDRWAIREFVKRPDFVAHCIRDHKEHTAPLMGGLWGLRKSANITVSLEYAHYREDIAQGHRLAHDQNFLLDVLYPKIVERLLVHYSNGRARIAETAVEFPFEWTNDVYCGRIETAYKDTSEPPAKYSASNFSIAEPSSDFNPVNFLHKR